MELQVILSEGAILPSRAHPTDSGLDLYTAEPIILQPNETKIVRTGVTFVIPEGYEIQVRPRSGVTSKTPLRVHFGTVDQSYTGDCSIIVTNTGTEALLLQSGHKLAQAVLCPVMILNPIVVTELPKTSRGAKGFGSSGV